MKNHPKSKKNKKQRTTQGSVKLKQNPKKSYIESFNQLRSRNDITHTDINRKKIIDKINHYSQLD